LRNPKHTWQETSGQYESTNQRRRRLEVFGSSYLGTESSFQGSRKRQISKAPFISMRLLF
jgi:hypothetical protein